MSENVFSFHENEEEFHDVADSGWDDLLESALDDTYYRLNCPDSEELVDYQEGILAFSRQGEIKDHLTLCSYCQEEMVMLADLDDVPFPLPPKAVTLRPSWSDVLEQLKQAGKKIIEAIVPPLLPTPAFAVRGGNSPYLTEKKPTQMKRVYHANEYQIRLTITPPAIAEEIWKIHGEIYHPTLWDLSGQVYLFMNDQLAAQTILDEDEDGEFAFENLQAGQYRLLFDMPEAGLPIEGFRLEWSPEELADLLLTQVQADNNTLPRLLESLRPNLTLELIEEFKQRVDGEMYRDASDALKIADVAEAAADFIPNPEAKALALWAKGNALHILVRNQDALVYYQHAESIYAKQERQLEVIRLQGNQVAVLREIGEYEAGLTLYKKARVIGETIGSPAQQYLGGLEMNIGATYRQLGDLSEALKAYERAYTLLSTLPGGGPQTPLAMININQANVLREMDNFAKAEPLYVRAREAFVKLGHNQEVARADLNLGRLAYSRGQYQVSLRYLEKARNGFVTINNPREVAFVDLYRSFVYRQLNLLQETLDLAISSERTFKLETMSESQALALINQGVSYRRLGDYVKAKERITNARQIFQEQGAKFRVLELDLEQASLVLTQGNLGEAKQLANQVEQQIDSAHWPSFLARYDLLLAEIAFATIPPKLTVAEQHTNKALEIAKNHNLHEVMIDADHLMAQIFEQHDNLQAGLQTYYAAIKRIEELRTLLAIDEFQLGFMEDKLSIYDNTVRLCHNMATQATNGKSASLAQMFYTLNLAVAAPLRRLPASQKGSLAFDDDSLRQELDALREQWYWHHSKLEHRADIEKTSQDGRILGGEHVSQAELYQELRQLENQIAELMRRLQVRTTHVPVPSEVAKADADSTDDFLAAVQASLKPKELLLQYYFVEGQVQALLVTPSSTQLVPNLYALSRLEKRYQKLREDLTNPQQNDLGRINQLLYRFYQILVAPIEEHMANCEKIFLVTPPDWHDLPFSALFDRQTYLANRFQLTYLSAPEVLLRTDERRFVSAETNKEGSSHNALVIGYSDEGDLPQTVAEARQIAQLLTPHLDATLLLEEDATLSTFKKAASNSKLLHLASHAVFRTDNPLFSWVHLAKHHLTVTELYDQITLSQEPLVVLSACQTGLGKPRGGGLLGMARGFMVAGANGLIVTLWKVADHTTAELMRDFYTALLHHSASPSAALHYAKQQAIARGYHPYHWAGFIFIQG